MEPLDRSHMTYC